MNLAAFICGSPLPFGGYYLHKMFLQEGKWKTSTAWGLPTDRQGSVFNDTADVLMIPHGQAGWVHSSELDPDEQTDDPIGWWRPLTEEEWNRTIRHEAQRA